MQHARIEENRLDLVDVLRYQIDAAIPWFRVRGHLTQNQVDLLGVEHIAMAKASKLLDILMTVDNGSNALVQYLHTIGCSLLARKLTGTDTQSQLSHPAIQNFRNQLAEYYRDAFSIILPEMGGTVTVESVFVDMDCSNKRGVPLSQEDVRHETILRKLKGQNYPIMIIEGQPGFGKTTLVKKIASDWARLVLGPNSQQTSNPVSYPLLFVIPLRQLHQSIQQNDSSNDKLINSALNWWSSTTKRTLNAGDKQVISGCEQWTGSNRCLFLLDGLDEYTDERCSELDRILAPEDVVTLPPLPGRIILTSRPHAVKKLRTQQFSHYGIKGLTPPMKMEFVHKRIEAIETHVHDNVETRSDGFMRQADQSGLNDIIKAPLMLHMCLKLYLAAYQSGSAQAKLPDKLFDLFSLLCQQNFEHAKQRPIKSKIDQAVDTYLNLPGMLKLYHFALKCIISQNGGQLVFSKSFAQPDIDFDLFVELNYLTVPDDPGSSCLRKPYDIHKADEAQFVHQSFQEFFAAEALCKSAENDFNNANAKDVFHYVLNSTTEGFDKSNTAKFILFCCLSAEFILQKLQIFRFIFSSPWSKAQQYYSEGLLQCIPKINTSNQEWQRAILSIALDTQLAQTKDFSPQVTRLLWCRCYAWQVYKSLLKNNDTIVFTDWRDMVEKQSHNAQDTTDFLCFDTFAGLKENIRSGYLQSSSDEPISVLIRSFNLEQLHENARIDTARNRPAVSQPENGQNSTQMTETFIETLILELNLDASGEQENMQRNNVWKDTIVELKLNIDGITIVARQRDQHVQATANQSFMRLVQGMQGTCKELRCHWLGEDSLSRPKPPTLPFTSLTSLTLQDLILEEFVDEFVTSFSNLQLKEMCLYNDVLSKEAWMKIARNVSKLKMLEAFEVGIDSSSSSIDKTIIMTLVTSLLEAPVFKNLRMRGVVELSHVGVFEKVCDLLLKQSKISNLALDACGLDYKHFELAKRIATHVLQAGNVSFQGNIFSMEEKLDLILLFRRDLGHFVFV